MSSSRTTDYLTQRRLVARPATEAPAVTMSDDPVASFEDLAPDIQVQVMQFLPLKSRVRMERVCRNWAAILDYVWKRQKRLAICFANRYELDACHDPSHRFTLSDIIVDSNHSFVHTQRESFSIVKRCPNLIALYFSANQVATNSFGSDLAHFCPKLEHISLRDTTSFLAFASYATSAEPNHMRCLQIDSDDQDADDDFDDEICDFISHSPGMESLTNLTNYNTISLIEMIAPKLMELKMGSLDELAVPFLVSGATRLKRLAIKCALDTDSIRLILTLKHLQHLEICATTHAVLLLAHSSIKLKSLTLVQADSEGFSADDLHLMLSQNSQSLRRLEVAGLKIVASDMSMFGEYCRRLRSLHVLPSDPLTMNQQAIQSLSRLTDLRDLEIGTCILTHNQLNLLLNSMPKLKEVSLINTQSVHPLREALIAYARQHPHRQMIVWCNYDDRPNASPPRRRSENRPVRRPPGLTNIEIHGNIRIIYSH